MFDVTYLDLISETVRLENQFWPSSVLPIFHTHFRMIGNTAKPIDYQSLLDDSKYTNMIIHRKHFRELAIEKKNESLVDTESLLTIIDNYLGLTEE